MDFVSLKRQAKSSMSGGWGMAIIATIIYLVLCGIAGFTYIGTLIVAGPLAYGFYAYIANQMTNHTDDLNLLFVGFKNRFVDTMVAGIIIAIITCVGCLLLIVPGIIAALGLSMTYLIMLDFPGISGVDACKASWMLMKGHKWELFCLMLSFIGWGLLCIITCGLLTLYVTPYMYATYIAYYRRISAGFNPNLPFAF